MWKYAKSYNIDFFFLGGNFDHIQNDMKKKIGRNLLEYIYNLNLKKVHIIHYENIFKIYLKHINIS
jgi:hypothetical protein